MDGEVSEMRSALRRSVDLQNEAALLKDRYAAEATLAQQATETLRSETGELRARLAQLHEDHQGELDTMRRAAEEERQRLRERVAALTTAQQEALSAAQKERDRCSHLHRSVQQQVDSARAESTAEVTALRRAAAQAREECQRLAWQGERQQEQLQDAGRAAEQQEGQRAALQAQVQKLEQDLDRAVQREAWVAAEKKHTEEQLAAAQQQLQSLSEVAARHEQATFDLDRLRMLLQSRDAELQESRREARGAEGRLADLEDAATARLQTLRRELRQAKKLAKSEAAKGDVLRRKLVEALVHQESARTSCYLTGGTGTVPLVLSTGGAAAVAEYPSSDVINLLRSQNEQAALLHNKLLELSR
ncbi:hypothetical protein STCU_04778 [Strigomonas culicis]|uniref:Uncharacterized protein n=1 Tax=Strigomonas culicis TaxID=28005 RepID=S9UJP2_9TRYP|nr:hypothetical protein STCU_04778 [Strigomonas culicis]|eukprot:EPY28994.1 hypothetical protein STCU_04778 [Strigomonas culicis]